VRKLWPLIALLVPAVSQAWWNNDWQFRKEVSFDLTAAGANITGTAQEVPVLVRLSLGNFGYFKDTKPDGSDLRFIGADDKTPLTFHIERYDAVNQMAFIWVRVPRLAGGVNTDKVFLYYGNPKAPAASNAAGTYDPSQAAVFHFAEKDGLPVDSTANGSKPSASTAELNPASLIAGGAKFTGSNAVTVPSTAALRLVPGKGATASAWVRIDAPQTDGYLMALEDGGKGLVLAIAGSTPVARILRAGAVTATAQGTAALSTGQWHHLAVTVGAGKLILYADGAAVANSATELEEIAGTLSIGNAAAGGHGLIGEVDEAQFAIAVRTPEWLQVAARSQGQDTPLIVYGNDAQRETEKVSYFGTTLRNVTPDGWAVIGVLAIMFVVAIIIIVGKAIYLSQVARANARFLKEFELLRDDPTALDRTDDAEGDAALDRSALMPGLSRGDDQYRMSTIYRLYHHGVQEMTGRVGLKSAGAKAVRNLSPQAIASIRATMDATLVRLTQKLQSQMVLLTIAIAGGPFLGLLGTVVGVMITFAAIAASGDVNVNSIAPGIAAALVATVAGLGVAIPALFGYNWLNTRIKNIVADMRVFVDEFVTRIAEHYS
jgi:biopolymer transport protein ExbB